MIDFTAANYAMPRSEGTLTPCQQGRADDWHSEKLEDRNRAITLCKSCPLIEACREIGRDEERGIWGGLTPTQRDHWRRTGKIVDDTDLGPRYCRAGLHDLTQPGSRRPGMSSCLACWNKGRRIRESRRLKRNRKPQPRKDRCQNGHDLTDPANIDNRSDGARRCRACAIVKQAERRAARKAGAAA